MPLILDRKQIEKAERRKARRLPKLAGDNKAERELRKRMQILWKKVLFPASERLQEMVKQGSSVEDVAEYIDRILHQAETRYDIEAKDIVTRWQLSLDDGTRKALKQGLSKSLGVDIDAVIDTPDMQDALAVGSLEAVNLIKSVPETFFGRIAEAVMDNFTGKPLPENRSLLQQIQAVTKQTEKRSKVIARDQTKKLKATLNQTRQTSLGIDTYIWRTVKDQRVVGKPGGVSPEGNKAHGNHYIMEGKYCRWDDPTVYSKDQGKTWIKRKSEMPKNHPGQDIQCRCHAEPVIDIEKILENSRVS